MKTAECILKFVYSHEKLHSNFDNFEFFINRDSGQKITDLAKVQTLKKTEFFSSHVKIF